MPWRCACESRRALCALALLLVAAPPGAYGQGHPLPKRDPTLLERMARSNAIALARVEAVDPGRLQLQTLESLSGDLPTSFAVKRTPSRPPPYEAGDFAVLFLRGARSPFVLVEAPRELIRSEDEAAARRIATAVRDLRAAEGNPERLLALHLAWLRGEHDTLRALAVTALLDPRGPLRPLPASFGPHRAREAMDSERSLAERRAAALLAVTSSSGLIELVDRVPGSVAAADPEIARLALSASAARGLPGAEAAVLRCLTHADPPVRWVGIHAAAQLRHVGNEIRHALQRIVREDVDPESQRRAKHTLHRLGVQPAK